MVIHDTSLEEIASRLAVDITQGQWGDDTTAPDPSDTGLISPIAATLLDLDSAVASGNSILFQHTVPSTVANPSTFAEYQLLFDNAVSANRSVGASFLKTSSFDVTTLTTWNLIRG